MPEATTKTCKNCGQAISQQFINAGGPIGGMADGWLHAADGQTKCKDENGGVLATEAVPEPEGESE